MPRSSALSPAIQPSADPARFDWALVRSFLAVLDAGSLTGAARRTGALQPTLSRHIAELEEQLGAPLFERTGRGVTPTAAGLSIVEAARRMHDGADALARALAGHRHQTTGVVRITASQVAASHLLPPIVADLQQLEPGVQIELVASNALSNLLRREADIAVRMVRPAQGSLVARKVGEVGIGAYAHTSYLARAGMPRQPQDLLNHRLVGMDTDDTLMRGFASMGFTVTREHFAVRTDDHLAYGRLVVAGAGIGFLAHYNAVELPGLRPVLPQLRIPALPCWLAVHREIRSSRVVRRVYDHLAQALTARLTADNGRPGTASAAKLL